MAVSTAFAAEAHVAERRPRRTRRDLVKQRVQGADRMAAVGESGTGSSSRVRAAHIGAACEVPATNQHLPVEHDPRPGERVCRSRDVG